MVRTTVNLFWVNYVNYQISMYAELKRVTLTGLPISCKCCSLDSRRLWTKLWNIKSKLFGFQCIKWKKKQMKWNIVLRTFYNKHFYIFHLFKLIFMKNRNVISPFRCHYWIWSLIWRAYYMYYVFFFLFKIVFLQRRLATLFRSWKNYIHDLIKYS